VTNAIPLLALCSVVAQRFFTGEASAPQTSKRSLP
jgi:hypothetical protein